MTFQLRDARPGDEPRIQRVVNEVLAEFEFGAEPDGLDADLVDIQASYVATGGIFLVLVDESASIVGCGGLFPFDRATSEVRKMYFVPGARGQGWGRRLLVRLIEFARERRFERLVLETASKLSAAGALYRSVGFVEVQREHLAERCDSAMALDLRV